MNTTEIPPWEGEEQDWSAHTGLRVAATWTARGDAQRERQRKGVYEQPALFDKHREMPFYQNIIRGGNY